VLRIGHYGSLWEQSFTAPGGEWSARDRRSIGRTFSGLTKLIFPSGEIGKEAEFSVGLRRCMSPLFPCWRFVV
jgi:predicted ATP-dependent Lon-type protease